jgi:hypothetical protein
MIVDAMLLLDRLQDAEKIRPFIGSNGVSSTWP